MASSGRTDARSILNYVASTDVMNAVAISATTQTDVNANQSFTVNDAGSIVVISVRGCINISSAVASSQYGARILIDDATAYKIGGGIEALALDLGNALTGSSPVVITGLAAGAHTVKVQVYTSQISTGYCRASGQPNYESLAIDIVELR